MGTKIHVEVFVASQLLGRRQEMFTAEALRREIQRLFGDSRPGVNTHISAHCVANAPRNAATVYNYLWRLDQGLFRVFDPVKDWPHSTRADAACFPRRDNVPSAYRCLVPPGKRTILAQDL